jgi:hypothetical protein
MTAAVLALLAAIVPALLDYLQQRKEAPRHDANDHIQQARQALADNDGLAVDAAAVAQHDRVSDVLAQHRRGRG